MHHSCLQHNCVGFSSPEQALFDDLARHFQISRNADQVGGILVNLMRTDFDFGLATEALNILRGNQDTLLAKMSKIEVSMWCSVVTWHPQPSHRASQWAALNTEGICSWKVKACSTAILRVINEICCTRTPVALCVVSCFDSHVHNMHFTYAQHAFYVCSC